MKVQVVSSWYPSKCNPYSGNFVRSQVRALLQEGVHATVEVPMGFATSPKANPLITWQSLRAVAEKNIENCFRTEGEATYIPCPIPANPSSLEKAKSFAKGIHFKREFLPTEADVIHAHLGLPTGLALTGISQQPLIVTEHQSNLRMLLAHRETRESYKQVIHESAAFLCVSEFLKKQITSVLDDPITKSIQVVPNVLDFSELEFIRREAFQSLSWIYVGNLTFQKGVSKLLKTFALYKKKVEPTATLTLIGNGPLHQWIKKFAQNHDLEDSINLCGAQPHSTLKKYFSEADLMVHLSEYETFGIAPLEAIVSGIPVITLNNGGSDETLGDLKNKCVEIIEKPSSEKAIVERIIHLTARSDKLDLAGACQIVKSRYSAEIIAKQLLSIYQDCLS